MDASDSRAMRFFRQAWWFAAGAVLVTGLWQGYGSWLWSKAAALV